MALPLGVNLESPPLAIFLFMPKFTEKERGYLVGLYYGDGYIYYDKSRHYTISFFLNSIKDNDILNYLKKVLLKQGYNVFINKDKRGNWFVIKLYSQELYNYLYNYELIKLNFETINFKIGFISGVIDAEGYIRKSTIEVINTDLELLQTTQNILNELNIKSNLKKRIKSKKDKKDSYRLLVSTKIKTIKHNSQKVYRHYPAKAPSQQTNYP
jgi:intein-encoded DNA endonuclease-like protein